MFFSVPTHVPEIGIVPAVQVLPVAQAGERANANANNALAAPEPEPDPGPKPVSIVTRSGRNVKPVERFGDNMDPNRQTYAVVGKQEDGPLVQDLTYAEMAFYVAIGAVEICSD